MKAFDDLPETARHRTLARLERFRSRAQQPWLGYGDVVDDIVATLKGVIREDAVTHEAALTG